MEDIQVIQVKPQNLRVGFDFFILGNSANRLTTRDTRNVMIAFFLCFFMDMKMIHLMILVRLELLGDEIFKN